MNKKIIIGVVIVLVVVAVGIVGTKAMLGDTKIELPYEEQTEKVVGLQENLGATESGKNGANAKQP